MKKKIFFSFLLCLFIIANNKSFSQSGWEWLNPKIPDCNYYSVHFPSKDIGYAVGDCGTVIKTYDAGNSWITLNTGINKNLRLRSVHFINNFFGTVLAEYCAYKTMDGGQSWILLPLNCSSLFNAGSYYYGIWPVSEDTFAVAGRGWMDYPPEYYNIPYAAMDISYSGGSSWTCYQYDYEDMAFTSVYFTSNNTGYMGSAYGNIRRTENMQNWSLYIGPTSDNIWSFSFPDEQIGFAVGGYGLILKTADSGTSWAKMNSGITTDFRSVDFIDVSTGYVTGTSGTIMQTKDTGSTWLQIPSNTLSNLNSVCFTNDSTGYFVGDNGTILKTTDQCDSLTPYISSANIITSNNLNSVYFPSKNAGYVVGAGGLVLKTIDLGNTWSSVFMIGHPELFTSFFTNDTLGYVAGANGAIFQTQNGGSTWSDLWSGATSEIIYTLFFINDSTGFAAGAQGSLIKTTSPNVSWQILNSGTTNNIHSIYFLNVDTGYAVGDNGTLLKTVDSGVDWIPILNSSFVNYQLTSVRFSDSENGYITAFKQYGSTYYGFVFRTFDGGNSWSIFPNNNSIEEMYSVFPIDDLHVYVAGDRGTIIKTNDGFSSNIYFGLGCNKFNSVYFLSPDTGFVVGDGGAILRTISGVTLDIKDENDNQNSFEVLVYPNPVENDITFSFELNNRSPVVLNIYDPLGHLISKSEYLEKPQGICELKITCSNFVNSLYYYQLILNDKISSGKFIKQ